MNTSHLIICVAIPMPTIGFIEQYDEDSRTVLYDMLDELCSLSGTLEFTLSTYTRCKPHIELLENAQSILSRFKPRIEFLDQHEILKISSDVVLDFDVEMSEADGSKIIPNEKTLREARQFVAQSEFMKCVFDIFIAANISRIGSLELRESYVIQDDRAQKYSKLPQIHALPLQRATKLSQRIGWPQIKTLDFMKVWNWLNSISGFRESFGGGSTGRALNAFSRIFESQSHDEALQLVWSLIGIEALYGKGRTPVMEQIRDKTQTLLGKQDSFKKKIGEMYDYRSRFMHGDLDFPGLYLIHDADESFARYLDDQSEAVDMAVAILTATLQELIVRDWKSLNFFYTASDGDS